MSESNTLDKSHTLFASQAKPTPNKLPRLSVFQRQDRFLKPPTSADKCKSNQCAHHNQFVNQCANHNQFATHAHQWTVTHVLNQTAAEI